MNMHKNFRGHALVIVIITSLAIMLLAGDAGAEDSYEFIAKWGSEGFGDGQFSSPFGIAVDSSENVYVADYGNHRIQKFNASGVFLTKWGGSGSGDGQFYYPRGIAVDNNGNGYVADTQNHRIQKFSVSGGFITKWGSSGSGDDQFNIPIGIAVDSSGKVYVADTYNNRIQKFNALGVFKSTLGSSGSGDGQLNYPHGIAVDSSGNGYVADLNNNRIQKFSASGVFITKWGSSGSGDGQFSSPFGIAVDSSGNVYVADLNNNRIQKFSASGAFITKWGRSGSGDGQFNNPSGIAVDSSGNVYVADLNNNRIQKFRNVTSTSTPNAPPTASITDLTYTNGTTWINWTWRNPSDSDFNHTIVYLNGNWKANISESFYNGTGLDSNTSYEIGTKTVNKVGNVNATWINGTASTLRVTGITATFFGGAGNQTGTGISINGGMIYVAGNVLATGGSNDEALMTQYAIPPASLPVWSRYWPYGALFSISSTNEGVYTAGTSYSLTSDGVGGKEIKGIMAKFAPNGSNGSGAGGSSYVATHNFFPYRGYENQKAVMTTVEGNLTFVYAAGGGQAGGSGGEYVVAKYDTNGNFLAQAIDSGVNSPGYSDGRGVTVLNGNIYVAGYTGKTYMGDNPNSRPLLLKYNPNLTLIWKQRDANQTGWFNGVTAFENAIYAVGYTYKPGITNSSEYLVQKYDEAGNIVWNMTSGGQNDDILTSVIGIGSQLFAVGYTQSLSAGGDDAVILEIDPTTGATISTTLFGGLNNDRANGAATDGVDLYVIGESRSFGVGGNLLGQNDAMLLRYTSASTPTATPVTGTIVSISDVTAVPDSNVTRAIMIDNVNNLAAATILLTYDPNVVKVLSVSTGDFGGVTPNIDNTIGKVTMSAFSTTGKSGSVAFANIQLKAIGSVDTTSPLTLTVTSLNDQNGAVIPYSIKNGILTISSVIKGDVNGDGSVTIVDALFVAQYTVGTRTLNSTQLAAGDVNGDGQVTIVDALFIAQYTVGLRQL